MKSKNNKKKSHKKNIKYMIDRYGIKHSIIKYHKIHKKIIALNKYFTNDDWQEIKDQHENGTEKLLTFNRGYSYHDFVVQSLNYSIVDYLVEDPGEFNVAHIDETNVIEYVDLPTFMYNLFDWFHVHELDCAVLVVALLKPVIVINKNNKSDQFKWGVFYPFMDDDYANDVMDIFKYEYYADKDDFVYNYNLKVYCDKIKDLFKYIRDNKMINMDKIITSKDDIPENSILVNDVDKLTRLDISFDEYPGLKPVINNFFRHKKYATQIDTYILGGDTNE